MIKIRELKNPTAANVRDINALLPQLTPSVRPMSLAECEKMLRSGSAFMIAAKDGKKVIGMATLVLFRIPVGWRARVEDVVVDENYRGQGLGEKILKELVKLARRKKAPRIDLTSNPKREGAIKLYKKMGFEEADTNVYRLKLK